MALAEKLDVILLGIRSAAKRRLIKAVNFAALAQLR